jgi:hypothetical protein
MADIGNMSHALLLALAAALAAFGTSPSRFRTMRQLDQVRRLVKSGSSLANAALDGICRSKPHVATVQARLWAHAARWKAALLTAANPRFARRSAAPGSCVGKYTVGRDW